MPLAGGEGVPGGPGVAGGLGLWCCRANLPKEFSLGGCNEQAKFSAWFWRMGWRYVAAIASLMMFGLLAARVFDEAETLRAPLMAGVVNILVLVLAVPIEKPKGERGWLKAAGSLGTSGALMYITWLSVHEEIELLVAGQGGDVATDWWIIGGYFVFSLIAAAGIVLPAWLVLSSDRKPGL